MAKKKVCSLCEELKCQDEIDLSTEQEERTIRWYVELVRESYPRGQKYVNKKAASLTRFGGKNMLLFCPVCGSKITYLRGATHYAQEEGVHHPRDYGA